MDDVSGVERRGCPKRDGGEVLSTGNSIDCLSKMVAQGGVKFVMNGEDRSALTIFRADK